MIAVVDDQLVFEEKCIYSIEKFLMARRLMYWQVYLHKTSISAEFLLVKILERVRYCVENGNPPSLSPSLSFFMSQKISKIDFSEYTLENFLSFAREKNLKLKPLTASSSSVMMPPPL